ncbi:hypothetical protein BaRGS_00036096, partial [Batillaria attramentaria]
YGAIPGAESFLPTAVSREGLFAEKYEAVAQWIKILLTWSRRMRAMQKLFRVVSKWRTLSTHGGKPNLYCVFSIVKTPAPVMMDPPTANISTQEMQEAVILQLLDRKQWEHVTGLVQQGVVQQGVSIEHRDMVLKEALRHSQWECVTTLVRLGVSADNRDLALHKAVRYRQWQCVEEVLRLGVSQRQRDFALKRAVQHEQFDLVSELVEAGVSFEQRNDAARGAVLQGQWKCVTDLIKAGISSQQRDDALKEAVRQNQWARLPELLRLSDTPTHTDFAVREAIRQCEWKCVTNLVKLGLGQDLKDYVFNEALTWGHLDCATEVMKQGVHESQKQWLVDELFRLGKWHRVIDLFVEGTLDECMRGFTMKRAARYGEFDAFLTIVQLCGVSEDELIQVMMAAISMYAHSFLHKVIRSTRNGRRVFKQLCLKQQFNAFMPFDLYINLVEVQETDLALYLAATHDLWVSVLSLYDDCLVSRKTRAFAFHRAVRQGAWEHVAKMARMTVTEQRHCRMAFLEAARQGECHLTLELCDSGFKVKERDLKFAIECCIQLGKWEFVVEYQNRAGLSAPCDHLIQFAIEISLKSDSLDCFIGLLRNRLQSGLISFACKTAFQYKKCNFVLALCSSDKTHGWFRRSALQTAAETGIEKGKWDFVRELVQNYGASFSDDHFVMCIQKIIGASDSWRICASFLDLWCKDSDLFWVEGGDNPLSEYDTDLASALVEWCLKTAFGNLAMFLSLLIRKWSLATEVVRELGNCLSREVLRTSACFTICNGASGTAAALLKLLDVKEYFYFDIEEIPDAFQTGLLTKCQEEGMLEWVVELAIRFDKWEFLDAALETCHDQSLINRAVSEAADFDQWSLIRHHIDRCEMDEFDLARILRQAVRSDESVECVKALLNKVDPLSATDYGSSLMCCAVESGGDRKEMLRLCVRAGLSSHERHPEKEPHFCSPMKQALQNGQLPLVRLLHESGSSSNCELFLLKNDASIRAQLERQRRQDIVQYLDRAASNPASLQHLCRLTVSHLVGCRPGRRDRVASLPLTWCTKDLVLFEDLT